MRDIRRKELPTRAEPVGERTVRFTITTGSPDRENDTINPAGWDLTAFRRNPTVLWAHRHDQPPIARAKDIEVTASGLRSTAEFPPASLYPFADQVYGLIKSGFINATSVGFRPIKSRYNEARKGTDFLQQELLEYSIVSVPANAEALVEARGQGVRDRKALDQFLGGRTGKGATDIDDLTPAELRQVIRDGVRAAIATAVKSEARRAVRSAAFKATGRLDYLQDVPDDDGRTRSTVDVEYAPNDVVLDVDVPDRTTEAGRQALCREAFRDHHRRQQEQAENEVVWNLARVVLQRGSREQRAALRVQLRQLNPDQVGNVPWDIRAKGGLPLLMS